MTSVQKGHGAVCSSPNRRREPGSSKTLEGAKAIRQARPIECTALNAAASCMRYPQAASSVTDACACEVLVRSMTFKVKMLTGLAGFTYNKVSPTSLASSRLN